MKIKLVLLGVLILAMGIKSYAQGYSSTNPNVITTAVPFVSIPPDARGRKGPKKTVANKKK